MDLERIKQNFRIRSGRSKTKKKSSKKTAPPQLPSYLSQPNGNLPNGVDVTHEEVKEQSKQDQAELSIYAQEQQQEQHPEQQSEQDPVSQTETADIDTQEQEEEGLNLDDAPERIPGVPPNETDSPESQQEEQDLNVPAQELSQSTNEPPAAMASPSSEVDDFDLKPPKARSKPPSVETLAGLLFSSGHLNTILHYPPQLARFSAFLQKYLPQDQPLLSQYLETQKAIKAVEYANAVAEGLKPKDTGDGTTTETRKLAAILDPDFEAVCNAAFKALVGTALPKWITYQLIKVCSECLINELTGRQQNMIMQDGVGGLSEVFCLADPNQEDNPVIYASEEFYRLTGYREDDAIGHNCRFLQGRQTDRETTKRLKEAISKGEETYEALLNYRRDGRPFINLLMIAPLHDNNGKVKYHIGAQIDVTGLVEGGRVLESFQRYLNRRNEDQKREERELAQSDLDDDQRRKKRALGRLRDLSEMFDLEESAIVRETSRANSVSRDNDDNRSFAGNDRHRTRLVLGDSDVSEDEEDLQEQDNTNQADWKLGTSGESGLSGKLPGIYDSFMLFRPYPSLRIVFVSPKLQKLGNVLQTPLLSHVAAPGAVLNGLTESLKAGVPVSAKLHFTPERGAERGGTKLRNGTKHEDGKNGKAIWVSCTPLLGTDEHIGVWMCVVVEKSKVGASRNWRPPFVQQADEPIKSIERPSKENTLVEEGAGQSQNTEMSERNTEPQSKARDETASEKESIPIKPGRVNSQTGVKPVVEMASQLSAERNQDTSTGHDEEATESKQEPEDNSASSKASTAMPEAQSKDNDDVSAFRSGLIDADHKAVIPPVEEYHEPTHNAETEGETSSYYLADTEGQDLTADEYVTTRSPTLPSTPNGRVLIEEEDEPPIDDITRQVEQSRTIDSSSPSPIWSPASEMPPSIPSDAQSADEDDEVPVASSTQSRHSTRSPDRKPPLDEEGPSSSLEESMHHTAVETESKPSLPVPATQEKHLQLPNEDEDRDGHGKETKAEPEVEPEPEPRTENKDTNEPADEHEEKAKLEVTHEPTHQEEDKAGVKAEHQVGPETGHKLEDEATHEDEDKAAHEPGHADQEKPEAEPAHEPTLQEKVDSELGTEHQIVPEEPKAGLKVEDEAEQQAEHEDKDKAVYESGYESAHHDEDKILEHQAAPEAGHTIKDDANQQAEDEGQEKVVHEPAHEPIPKGKDEAQNEPRHSMGQEAEHKIEHQTEDESAHHSAREDENKADPKVENQAEHQAKHEPTHEDRDKAELEAEHQMGQEAEHKIEHKTEDEIVHQSAHKEEDIAGLKIENQAENQAEDEEVKTPINHTDTDTYADDQSITTTENPYSPSLHMDYLRANTERWQQGHNPRRRVDLTKMNLSILDGVTDDDDDEGEDCAESPYSVD